jgi:cytochrome c oxidase subunit IV
LYFAFFWVLGAVSVACVGARFGPPFVCLTSCFASLSFLLLFCLSMMGFIVIGFHWVHWSLLNDMLSALLRPFLFVAVLTCMGFSFQTTLFSSLVCAALFSTVSFNFV